MSAGSRTDKMKKRHWVALGMALLTAACSPPTPAAPTPVAPTIVESFTGTLTVLGTNQHPFLVRQVGGVRVTLSSVDPAASVRIGLGTISGPTCVVVTSVLADPGSTPQLSGTATVTGNFCVSISDPGSLAEQVTYTVALIHS
jgi:hypothetical protein